MKRILYVIFLFQTIFMFGQKEVKEAFTKKGATFFIHTHRYMNKKTADSLSNAHSESPIKLVSTSNKKDTITLSNTPRIAYYNTKDITYFRINPKEYITFDIRKRYDSIFNESNFSNISKISREDLTISVFSLYNFKELDNYKFKKRYKDFSKYKLLSSNKGKRMTIAGYDCYEIILEYDLKILKMYVTEGIELNYHPIINDLEILKKYYPLYIKFMDKRFSKASFTEHKFMRGLY